MPSVDAHFNAALFNAERFNERKFGYTLSLSGGLTSGGALVQSKVFFVVTAGGLPPAGALRGATVGLIRSGALAPSSSLRAGVGFGRSGTFTTGGQLVKAARLSIAGLLAPGGVLKVSLSQLLAGALVQNGQLLATRAARITKAGTLASAGALGPAYVAGPGSLDYYFGEVVFYAGDPGEPARV